MLVSISLWLILVSVIISRSNHVAANGIVSLFFYDWVIVHVFLYHIFFIHSSISGRLGYFHFLVIVDSAAINIGMRVSFQIRAVSGHMPRSEIAGSYGNSVLSFLRNFHIAFRSACTNLHSHQQYQKVRKLLLFLHNLSSIYYLETRLLLMAVPTCVRWHLIVVLVCNGHLHVFFGEMFL